MPSQYSSDKRSLGEILSMTSPPLLVPEWQRNYSWETSEVDTFWQDILVFSQRYPGININDQEYFLGSVSSVDT
jgi:uncharacterized protein with ParB-like and HNH nuclease domain